MPFPPGTPEKIRDKLARSILPRETNGKMYAGRGVGKPCDGCDEPISADQVEYEFAHNGEPVRLHLGCAGVLEAERRKLKQSES
jgi:hypothetical protein